MTIDYRRFFLLAIFLSSFLLIDLYIDFDAPLSELFFRLPRLALSAAPAARRCFPDFAGMNVSSLRRCIKCG
jgi:hypothetical protein